MEEEQITLEEEQLPFCGFPIKEELMSHIESVISCIKEYEGKKAIVGEFFTNKGNTIYFIKKKGGTTSSIHRTLEKAVDRFIELEKSEDKEDY